jgi:hypothetical protein
MSMVVSDWDMAANIVNRGLAQRLAVPQLAREHGNERASLVKPWVYRSGPRLREADSDSARGSTAVSVRTHGRLSRGRAFFTL